MQDTYTGLERGTAGYRRALVALVAAGLASFNAMYATQSLLPALTEQLGVSPAAASLTVSALTGMLALAIVPVSVLSERFGRGRVMTVSALSATALGLALAFAPDIRWLIAGRALQGVLVAGVPAVAMAWISEEVDPGSLPGAMGRYVAGTTVGGLLGRLVPSGVLEFANWRWALAATAALALAVAVLMALVLPAQRRFRPRAITLRGETAALAGHWRDPARAALFVLAFLLMGVFVSLYNYLGYRLREEFGFSEAAVGLVFLIYLVGTWSSARAGAIVARLGRPVTVTAGILGCVLGALLTLSHSLPLLLAGVAVLTGAFFAAHSTASGWVGVLATEHRAEASSTYLLCYYLGSSVVGFASGLVFHAGGWAGLVAWLVGLLALALGVVALALRSARKRARLVNT